MTHTQPIQKFSWRLIGSADVYDSTLFSNMLGFKSKRVKIKQEVVKLVSLYNQVMLVLLPVLFL